MSLPILAATADASPASADAGRVTKEFEDFAYAVSHDLGAPLRHIREFSRLLEDRLRDHAGEQERLYLHHVRESVKRMESMLDGLLQFSRLNTRAQPFEEVYCSTLLREVQRMLQHKAEACGAEISLPPHPPIVSGDPSQLKLLFFHLLDNALRFRRPETRPHIAVEAVTENGMHRFSVTDDGAGIAPQMQEKIFGMFARSCTEDEHGQGGAGIGLALCKRIVERHGGELWVQSTPGKGSVFVFTLSA